MIFSTSAMKFLTFLVFINIIPGLAFANPTMFVKEQRNSTWEGDLILVPNATQDAGVSVNAINAFLRKRLSSRAVESPAANFVPICLMNFARVQDVVSSDRKTQADIRKYLEEYPRSFSENWTTGGETFLVRVGIFEDCPSVDQADDGPLKFMALVITDPKGEILEFNATNWNFVRIFKKPNGNINVLGCFACGEVQEIQYNQAGKDFYYKWIGH